MSGDVLYKQVSILYMNIQMV